MSRGARRTEAALVEEVLRSIAPPERGSGDGRAPAPASASASLSASGAPVDLRAPVRVVVPSRSLRWHVSAAIVGHAGRPVLGVVVQTLHGVALEILGAAGRTPRSCGPLYAVLVREAARRRPALRRSLEELREGYGAVAATVGDVLNAGLRPERSGEVEATLQGLSGDDGERARALVDTAIKVHERLDALGLERPSTIFRSAAELLDGDAELLAARAVLVHGFAEATGLAADLLEALVRRCGATVLLDRPPDPAEPQREDAGAVFTERLVERLSRAAPVVEGAGGDGHDVDGADDRGDGDDTEDATGGGVDGFVAAGSEAEVREVARRIRRLLDDAGPDGDPAPEEIGVVARSLEPYRRALRVQLKRLGVPFSGIGGEGPLSASGRRLRALADVLRDAEAVTVDRWLDAVGDLFSEPAEGEAGDGRPRTWARRFDLRLAMRAMGAGRLAEAAALPLEQLLDDRDEYRLPARHGLWESGMAGDDGASGSGPPVATRRKLSGAVLRRLRQRAELLRAALVDWPDPAPFADHLRHLRALVREHVRWSEGAPAPVTLRAELQALEETVPADHELPRDEFVRMTVDALHRCGREPLGGAGGGVQVLGVMEARGRTFRHVFLLGLNRGSFPRAIREDPLLSDRVRRRMAEALPELPIKSRGFEEERYLFAQLLSSAESVTVSCLAVDDDGQERTVSPLLSRLQLAGRLPGLAAVPYWMSAAAVREREPRTPREHAVLAGLHGSRDAFAEVLPAAADAARERARQEGSELEIAPVDLAAARVAVLRELDPDLDDADGRRRFDRLGPYFGYIGPIREAADLRRRDLHITTVERMSVCSWQVMLERLLRLEPPPDPLEQLPAVDRLMTGRAVHEILEEVVGRQLERPTGRSALDEVVELPAAPVEWPDDDELDDIVRRVCRRVVLDEGLAARGLARVLALRARPYLKVARRLDRAAVPRALGVEVRGALDVEDDGGNRRTIHFRADRVDRVDADGPGADSVLRLTDYKTGRPLSEAKRAGTRRRHHLQRVLRGRDLQAVAYLRGAVRALGSADVPARPEGRFLYLAEDVEDDDHRVAAAGPDDEDLADAFERAVRDLLAAYDSGVFFPRFLETSGRGEPAACEWCRVAEACLRGDSAARLRLARWTDEERRPRRVDEAAELEDVFRRIWGLPDRKPGES